MTAILKQNVAPGSTVYTDGLGGFAGLHAAGFKHIALKQPLRRALRKGASSVVPLADRAIGNLQHWLIGTYHGVSRAQLQAYLDEFVFRHNRRNQPHGGLSNAARPEHRAHADALSSHPGRARYAQAA